MGGGLDTLPGGGSQAPVPPPDTTEAFIFDWFLDAFSDRFLNNFPSQLGSPNPQILSKTGYQKASQSWFRFWKDFWSFFVPNSYLPIVIFRAPAAATARFRKNRIAKLTSHFVLILVPVWFHYPCQKTNKILPKFLPKTPLNLNRFLYRFWCHVVSILEPQMGPCWRHVQSKVNPKSPNTRQDQPRTRQDPQNPPQDRFFIDVGSIFGQFWMDLGLFSPVF